MSIISAGRRTAVGRTKPGKTNWEQCPEGNGIYVDIDTTSGRFSGTPVYITTIGGDSQHCATVGTTSIFEASATKFRIYIKWADGSPLTPETANTLKWHINWIGIEVPIIT
ncbi:MAG: hypothetical protein D3910_08325 [Candidatus Electrothrix sp. ATG2]|nr:hypothetical protein [Candidatus Electrothrix sp. ATG2]